MREVMIKSESEIGLVNDNDLLCCLEKKKKRPSAGDEEKKG